MPLCAVIVRVSSHHQQRGVPLVILGGKTLNKKKFLCISIFLLAANSAHAESWNILAEKINSTTGKTELHLNRYELMNPDECRKWVSKGAPPYDLSGETKIVDTQVFYSTKFIETGIAVVCQGTGKKGNVLISGPKENIEKLNLPIRQKK